MKRLKQFGTKKNGETLNSKTPRIKTDGTQQRGTLTRTTTDPNKHKHCENTAAAK